MHCGSCGRPNPEEAEFCMYCGDALEGPRPDSSQAEIDKNNLTHSICRKTPSKRLVITMIVIVVAIIILASTLAYLFQPIRGRGLVSATEILEGTSVQFDFNPTQGIGPFEYQWSFGDGGSSSEKNPTHTYTRTGTFTASVSVTNWVGLEYTWSRTITVRLPLVFIDQVYYPSYLASLMGDTAIRLYIDGSRVYTPAAIQPDTSHVVRLQIVWVIQLGPLYNENVVLDESGTITAPSTATDLHCDLHYDPWGDPKFTLTQK